MIERTTGRLRRIARTHGAWLCGVVVFAIAFRLYIYHNVGPILYPDSASYIQAAESPGLLSPTRTPGYPAWLALNFALFGKENFRAVVIGQKILGVLSNLLLYAIFWRLTRSRGLATLAAVAATLHLQIVSFETEIWTEGISAFFTASLVAWLIVCTRKACTYGGVILTGVLAAVLIMIKPTFVGAWAMVGVCMVVPLRRMTGARWRVVGLKLALLAAVPLLTMVGWSNLMWRHYRIRGMSCIAAVNISTIIAQRGMLPDVPDRYAAIKQVIGAKRNFESIYDVAPALARLPGYDAVSHRQLHDMARDTLERVPLKYAWRALLTAPESMANQYGSLTLRPGSGMGRRARDLYVVIEDSYFWLVNRLSWVLFPLIVVPLAWLERRSPIRLYGWMLVLGVVWYVVLFDSFFAYAEFGRHRIPIEALKLGAMHVGVFRLWRWGWGIRDLRARRARVEKRRPA